MFQLNQHRKLVIVIVSINSRVSQVKYLEHFCIFQQVFVILGSLNENKMSIYNENALIRGKDIVFTEEKVKVLQVEIK